MLCKGAKQTILVILNSEAAISIISKILVRKLNLKITEPSNTIVTIMNCARKHALGKIPDVKLAIGSIMMPTTFQIIENSKEKVHAYLHFGKGKLFLRYLDKSLKVPIFQAKKVEPLKTFSDKDNFFNHYKKEEIVKVKSYYTDEAITDEEDNLYTNSWVNIYSPAIYITAVEEFLTYEKVNKPELTLEEAIQALVQTDILSKKQKTEVILILKNYSDLFSTRLDKLRYAAGIQHEIDTEDTKPIKQVTYRIASDEQEFLNQKIKNLLDNGMFFDSRIDPEDLEGLSPIRDNMDWDC
ncbi:7487_t:CDS:2 [Cetraspora pellucida]|uniref:7487_t:CDS:1 n=1 Tax=Cetraspora pellucida TaxID=1433469 RepID=A0A9N9AJN9_9GLOM|nr:7487_t:CDS:2 [Cetraspora pellucida]